MSWPASYQKLLFTRPDFVLIFILPRIVDEAVA